MDYLTTHLLGLLLVVPGLELLLEPLDAAVHVLHLGVLHRKTGHLHNKPGLLINQKYCLCLIFVYANDAQARKENKPSQLVPLRKNVYKLYELIVNISLH